MKARRIARARRAHVERITGGAKEVEKESEEL